MRTWSEKDNGAGESGEQGLRRDIDIQTSSISRGSDHDGKIFICFRGPDLRHHKQLPHSLPTLNILNGSHQQESIEV